MKEALRDQVRDSSDDRVHLQAFQEVLSNASKETVTMLNLVHLDSIVMRTGRAMLTDRAMQGAREVKAFNHVSDHLIELLNLAVIEIADHRGNVGR